MKHYENYFGRSISLGNFFKSDIGMIKYKGKATLKFINPQPFDCIACTKCDVIIDGLPNEDNLDVIYIVPMDVFIKCISEGRKDVCTPLNLVLDRDGFYDVNHFITA